MLLVEAHSNALRLGARGAVAELGEVLADGVQSLRRGVGRQELVVEPLHGRVGHLVRPRPPRDAEELRVDVLTHAEEAVRVLGGLRVQQKVEGSLDVLVHGVAGVLGLAGRAAGGRVGLVRLVLVARGADRKSDGELVVITEHLAEPRDLVGEALLELVGGVVHEAAVLWLGVQVVTGEHVVAVGAQNVVERGGRDVAVVLEARDNTAEAGGRWSQKKTPRDPWGAANKTTAQPQARKHGHAP